jgi:type I restriction enzyme S subunit
VSTELPQGWTETSLGQLANYVNGKAFNKLHWKEQGLPIIRIQNLNNPNAPFNYSDEVHEERYKVQKDDLLIAWSASLGAYIWKGDDAWLNQHIFRVEPYLGIVHTRYLYYAVTNSIDELYKKSHGMGMVHVTKGKFEGHGVWLPPLNEQISIANKLDSVLAKVDAAQARLEKIPTLLKHFRQSVLAAATSGELTREWREREGKTVKAWKHCVISDVADTIDPNPSHRYPEPDDSGVPILSTQQFVGHDGWTIEKAKFVNRDFFLNRKDQCGFYETDIIFARKGRLGLARFAPRDIQYVLSHTVFIIRAKFNIESKFLLWALRQDSIVEWLVREMNSNTGVPTLGKAIFEKLPIYLPSIDEQKEIVRRIESLFTLADTVEKQYLEAKKRLDRLTQSLLAKAFRGELVPQDPNDEPAAELLKRIQAERNAQPPVKNKRSKPA